ncbi:MAG: NADH-quinone oxidoreductase subunit NuoF [Candidatus Coatesbacteria bacterium]|nr:NADH-quinone oxidoreductase subunit NuoF [Candidatus Coatesbacteria bacterium]
MLIKEVSDLRNISQKTLNEMFQISKIKFQVGSATCGLATGAGQTLSFLRELSANQPDKYIVDEVGCIGLCFKEPIVDLRMPGCSRIYYGDLNIYKAEKLVKSLEEGDIRKEWVLYRLDKEKFINEDEINLASDISDIYREITTMEDLNLFKGQMRIVMRNCGRINPEQIDQYIAFGGYKGLFKVLKEMSPDEVIEEIKASGLRGRGGAGFPTGLKWSFTRKAEGSKKYIICNADEGDPGAYMDRSVLEGDPHSVIEGMLIGAYAIGADEGYIYVRAEYPLAIKRLKIAIKQAREYGLLGQKVLGTDFSFDLKISMGAGAFVCGEETALIASIEGLPGEPRPRPPFPAQSGLFGKPTNINNVETWANIPVIIAKGSKFFSSIGTEKSKGTKVFSLVGKVKNTMLIEVPMGTTISEIVYNLGDGMSDKFEFKAIQTGGPSGGCIPKDLIDLRVDYEELTSAGAIMGSGGLIVMDEKTCMVDVARFFLEFLESESCGKCVPCRSGIKRMLQIIHRITQGQGEEKDIELLEEMAKGIKDASLCGLGQTAPNPILTTLKFFRTEYESHIKHKRCPAAVCKALIEYRVIPGKCTGCQRCVSVCPTHAITGPRSQAHNLDKSKCIKCGACYEVCKYDAIAGDAIILE